MSTGHQSVFRHLGPLQFGQGQTESECQNQHLSVNHPKSYNNTQTTGPLSFPQSHQFSPRLITGGKEGKPTLSQLKPRVFKMRFYRQNLPTGATNCKCDALGLEIRPLVAKRICGKRLFDLFQPLLGFARPPQPSLQLGLAGRTRLRRLQRRTDC